MLKKRLLELKDRIFSDFEKAQDEERIRLLEIKYLGRKDGELTKILRSLSGLSPQERQIIGKLANKIKKETEEKIRFIREKIQNDFLKKEIEREWLDITLPGRKPPQGGLHPLTQVQRQIEEIFFSMGFMILEGPELESDYYNFEALNIPPYHPAREMQDTFYVDQKGLLLRTHTSPVQIRAMKKYGAPFKAIAPGRVFRYEATDASHDNTFYQIEGIVIDKDINLSHLKAIMQKVLEEVFGRKISLRFRPGYFPFVEPGLELDLGCLICGGKGCGVCKKTGWIEFMGAGMVHPRVLGAGNIDSKEWQGFAFGFGLTRLVMMKYGISDIRLLMGGDLKFLKQF